VLPLRVEASVLQPTSIPAYQRHITYIVLWCRKTKQANVYLLGGRLIFYEKNIELQSNIIMITDGGLLQVGTEDKPFEHKAIITLHGHHRSKELPIYGTKVLAVRNGTLDLHGRYISRYWIIFST
jgi:hypothetical protein